MAGSTAQRRRRLSPRNDTAFGGERRRVRWNAGSARTADFPRTHRAGDQTKQGVRVRALNVLEGAGKCRAAAAELGLQVTPLEFKLADGLGKAHAGTRATELSAVESEATTLRLSVNVSEVGIDECDRVRPGLEAVKLGMMAIAASAPEKNLASKERFAPEGRESPGIEITRVDGPESHEAVPCAA